MPKEKPVSMSRRRRAAAILMAAVVAPTAMPAAAAPDQQVVLLAYRTTTGAAALDLQVDAPPGSRPSLLAAALVTVQRGRIAAVNFGGATLSGEADRAHLRADGRRTVLCEQGVCAADGKTYTAGTAMTVRNAAGDGTMNALFVVARGASVSYRAKTQGWAVKRVSLPFRVVSGSDVADAGAYVLGTGAEAFRDASAPGGGYGSVAISEPPCSEAASGVVSRGVGTLTLDGGETTPTFTCPTSRGALSSWSHRRTTWRVHGTVAGETTMAGARLFVMDLPRTLPVPRTWPWR